MRVVPACVCLILTLAAACYRQPPPASAGTAAEPQGWRRIVHGKAISMSVPPDAEYIPAHGNHTSVGRLSAPRFQIHLDYGNLPYGVDGPVNDRIAERREEQMTIDQVSARVIRFRRPVDPRAASILPRDPSDWRIGMRVLVAHAGPGLFRSSDRSQLFLDVGCEDAVGCADAERVVRSIKFHTLRNPDWRETKLPPIPLPEPR